VAWRYSRHGAVSEVLERVSVPGGGSVGDGEVLVRFLAAGVTPMDVADMLGVNHVGRKEGRNVATAAGNIGVAEVRAVGTGVDRLSVGDWVVPGRARLGTWRSGDVVMSHSDLVPVPKGIPVEQAALTTMAACAASVMLERFAQLQKGDLLVQNGAAGPIGQAVIEIAAQRGIQTVSFIPHNASYAQTVERLKALGGTVVVDHQFAGHSAMREVASDLPRPKLALDAVGGSSVTEMARMLAPRGTLVTYSGTAGHTVDLPASALVHNEISVQGFSLLRWLDETDLDEKARVIQDAAEAIRTTKLTSWIRRMEFADLPKAIDETVSPNNDRSIVVVMPA